mgnify:CR=1 FL=1
MGIKTDSTPMENPKDAEDCNVFKLFKLLGTDKQNSELKAKYAAGNFGYGHAKQELFELICDKYKTEREDKAKEKIQHLEDYMNDYIIHDMLKQQNYNIS